MPSKVNIIVYTKSAFLYSRIESAFLTDNCVHVTKSTSVNDCIFKLEEKLFNLSCIIVNDECDEKETLTELSNIRKAALCNIPLIFISSSNKISFFNEVINQGVNDIIVKPFTDDLLRERVSKQINIYKNRNVEIVSLNLFKYLNGELKKAEKGKFPLTIMLTTIKFEEKEKYSLKQKRFILDLYFNNIKGIFWDTDLFIKFDSKYFLGVFPFCDSKNEQIILNKNTESFNDLIKTNIIPSNCKMFASFVSYPDNIDNIANAFATLTKNIKTDFFDYNFDIQFNEYGKIKYNNNLD